MLAAHAQEMDGCDARRRRRKDLPGCAISSASGCLNWHRHMTNCPQKIASGSIRRSQVRFSKHTRKWPSEGAPLCVSWAWRDCNQVENAIRPFVVGRNGWLFADTPQGAEASTIIYLLMETAKANNLRLDDYLLHLFSILPERTGQRKDFAR